MYVCGGGCERTCVCVCVRRDRTGEDETSEGGRGYEDFYLVKKPLFFQTRKELCTKYYEQERLRVLLLFDIQSILSSRWS